MIVREIQAKSVLSKSEIYDYVVNPYVGCQHACSYCYARFMKRFTGHAEPWGAFVDVKVNAPDLLRKEIQKKKRGTVWLSGVCDPYQPLEATYRLSRQCLEILVQNRWPVAVQTRSPLVLRDVDILKGVEEVEVGLSITTASDDVRKRFEPLAPPIPDRLRAVEVLHRNGIRTYVMIAPILPGAEGLIGMLEGNVEHLIIDRMNYRHADWVYRKWGWTDQNTDAYFADTGRKLAEACRAHGIACRTAY
ncbi:MAG TPA: radical SAM protein [Kiritimatiellia bacterium]|nr:radical SAM protein [Kiritimatiellia bacterium]HPS07735.1 radical SAM protein [Kiritimatiellia bacterium]